MRAQVWSRSATAAAAAVALLAVVSSARAGAPPDQPAPGALLTDEAHLLTGNQRAALERQLRDRALESGSALSILVVPHLEHHEAIEDLARRTFNAAPPRADQPGQARVLLVVSTREHRAAIETGQGPAGIVPEIDARGILQRLDGALAHHPLSAALEEAVTAIAASARATAERRRPLPPDPLEARPPAPQIAPAADEVEPGPDEAAREVPGSAAAPASAPTPKGGRRSLMPGAYVLAAVVIIGLAIRRRRRLAEDRVTPPPQPVAPRAKLDRDVKSVGDRPMS